MDKIFFKAIHLKNKNLTIDIDQMVFEMGKINCLLIKNKELFNLFVRSLRKNKINVIHQKNETNEEQIKKLSKYIVDEKINYYLSTSSYLRAKKYELLTVDEKAKLTNLDNSLKSEEIIILIEPFANKTNLYIETLYERLMASKDNITIVIFLSSFNAITRLNNFYLYEKNLYQYERNYSQDKKYIVKYDDLSSLEKMLHQKGPYIMKRISKNEIAFLIADNDLNEAIKLIKNSNIQGLLIPPYSVEEECLKIIGKEA